MADKAIVRLPAALPRAWVVAFISTFMVPLVAACDPDGKRECAWVMEPEIKLEGTTEAGFIPVCARNRKTMKQDCQMQATLDYAKEVYGRRFRYVDIRFVSAGQIHTVKKITFCDGKS